MLAACEASEAKSALVREMNDAETRKYETLYTDIENGIEGTREDIKRTKEDLDEARRVRRNRMQYDALAKVTVLRPFIAPLELERKTLQLLRVTRIRPYIPLKQLLG